MRIRRWPRILFAAAVTAWFLGGCRCGRDINVSDGPEINKPPLSKEDPDAPRPAVLFPPALRQTDPTLNAFIERVLTICSRGDYDGFRELFGSAYEPTREEQFKKVWYGVESVEVAQVQVGPEKQPHYYVMAQVRLRKPDRKGREDRSVPVMVFKEAGEWRVGPPPQGAIDRLRALESQPATAPSQPAATGPHAP